MIARLGEVLYWAGCGVAVLALIPAVISIFAPAEPNATFFAVMFVVIAVLAWLIGRACLYVLAGR